MKSTHQKEDLFLKLAEYFDNAGIEYVVVSDTSQYPYNIGSDIDIIVGNSHLVDIPSVLHGFCIENNIAIVQALCHEQTAQYFVLNWYDERGKPCFMHPDICSDYYRNGKMFLSAKEMLAGRILAFDEKGNSKGFYIPAPSRALIYYLLKRIDKKLLCQVQQNYLNIVFKKDPNGAIDQINRFWEAYYANKLISALRTNHWKSVIEILPVLKDGLHVNLKLTKKSIIYEFCRIAKRVYEPTGLFVAFLKPDGAGKSTIINHIKHDLKPAFRRAKRYHLRPQIIRNGYEGVQVTDPHGQVNRGVFTSIMKLGYWVFDYLLGYIVKVRPKLIQSTLILFDRYYHDILVDSRRYRYGAPLWIANFIGNCIPSPDLWILLDAPARIIQSRKQELTIEDTEKQRKLYQEVTKRFSNHVIVDASKQIDKVIFDVDNVILNFMMSRTKKRLKLPVENQ
jgi:thymidylate kinase